MICIKPFFKGDVAFGCGQCLPCRIKERRIKTHRIILEAFKHEKSCFITLTYSDEFIPPGASLDPEHFRNFLKRLRDRIKPYRFRYFGVGEYGDETGRPHYHAALFGLGVDDTELISSCWAMGNVYNGTLTVESAQYIAGYVTKKMTKSDDPRLGGRYPEFSRMSLKPGIGAGAIEELTAFFKSDQGKRLLDETGDVPLALMHGGRSLPLGRYLRRKLREALSLPEVTASENPNLQRSIQEMSTLFEASGARTKWQKLATYQKSVRPKVRSIVGRHAIHKKDKKL
ncbi:replication initiator protein [Apis mellifera associated microvirus 53]|nr:replication initiator protein [Apis mellifera associated microvirus 53]